MLVRLSMKMARMIGFSPVYWDLKVVSISSIGIDCAVFVTTLLTSSGEMVRISIVTV